MANYVIRSLLSSATFPFATELWGRSIILHQQDQNYDSATINAPGVVIDKGIPQAFYMHNVVPTNQGFQSVGYSSLIAAAAGPVTDFDHCYPIQTANGSKFLFVPAAGKNYIYDANVGTWQSVSPFAVGTVPANVQVTTAFVHGETYIFYANNGCYIYDPIGNVLVPTVLTSLTIANINGICAANNYMIAFSNNGIAWSSAVTPTDFTPSLTTGAGGGGVNEAKGNIVVCVTLSGGFAIYCDINIVYAKYTGNILFPFVTKEVPASGGISDLHKVTWLSNLSSHIAWTSAGLQQVGPASAEDIYTEVSDFIAARIFEDFDETTNTLSSSYLATQLFINLSVISQRFLIVSYGTALGSYTHAIFYDIGLKRYGKLKINHVDCFEWNFPNLSGNITYGKLSATTYGDLSATTYSQLGFNVNAAKTFKQALAFLQADGTVQVTNFDISETTANGVLIIGKFQMARGNLIEHQELEVDTIGSTNTFTAFIYTSLDGKTLGTAQALRAKTPNPSRTRNYQKMTNSLNFSYLFKGQFNLVSLLTTITLGGSS
jgi:hypothetical protein